MLNYQLIGYKLCERGDRQTDTQTDRQTDRDRDRETERDRDRDRQRARAAVFTCNDVYNMNSTRQRFYVIVTPNASSI